MYYKPVLGGGKLIKSILFRLDLRLELLSLYGCKGFSNLFVSWSFAFPPGEIYNLIKIKIGNIFKKHTCKQSYQKENELERQRSETLYKFLRSEIFKILFSKHNTFSLFKICLKFNFLSFIYTKANSFSHSHTEWQRFNWHILTNMFWHNSYFFCN